MKIQRLTCVLTVFGALLVSARQGQAAVALFANLTHDQETGGTGTVPPTTATGAARPLSFGTATFLLNDAQTALTMSVTINNIDVTGTQTADANDNLTAAHIHAGLIGVAGGVVWGFFGAPDSDINPDNLVVTPFAQGVGGTFTSTWDAPEGQGTTLSAQLNALLNAGTYLNFHTTQFGGGEIRGQIVPEPGSAMLAAGSLLALAGVRRRRQATGS